MRRLRVEDVAPQGIAGPVHKCASKRPAARHTKIQSTVRHLGVELDDALTIAEQVDV
jgi:hypothetical protein